MKQRQKRPNKATKLNPRQYLAITHLITGQSIDQTARESGIGDRTLTRWLTIPEFKAELERRLDLQVEEAFGIYKTWVRTMEVIFPCLAIGFLWKSSPL